MKRRDFCTTSVLALGGAIGAAAGAQQDKPQPPAAPAPGAVVLTPRSDLLRGPAITQYVANFIVQTRFAAIPPDVMELGRKSILDGLGLALAGSVSTLSPIVQKYLASLGSCAASSRVIGTDHKVPARFAAFANGSFIHADDYDDTQLAVAKDRVYGLLTHPTVTVLAPVLALGEARDISGKDLLTAYHVGVEVECKIAEAIAPRHYNDGFHTTGTVGSFGSAAASARLLGLDARATQIALGIAAAQAGGLRENFGTMTKPFHAGHAAEAGVVAADLAALGWTAATNILEAPYGFFHAAGGGFDAAAISEKLGSPWTFASPGVSIKPHPSGSLTHPAMDEMLRLVREHDIKPEAVATIDVGGNERMVSTLLHHHPTTGLQAKFSMEYGVSVIILERKANLEHYTDDYVRRPAVQELLKRVNFYVDQKAQDAGFDKMTSIVRVRLKDGRSFSGTAQFAKGSPANPMSFEEVAEKFRGCADFAKWPSEKAEAVVAAVRNLEKEDARKLAGLLAA
jgi:2-methylcitrate dehydratase PrpD